MRLFFATLVTAVILVAVLTLRDADVTAESAARGGPAVASASRLGEGALPADDRAIAQTNDPSDGVTDTIEPNS
jgi:hypothetical protein